MKDPNLSLINRSDKPESSGYTYGKNMSIININNIEWKNVKLRFTEARNASFYLKEKANERPLR